MTEKISVAHIVLSLDVGGLEALVVNIAQEQVNRGWGVHVICLDSAGKFGVVVASSGAIVKVIGRRPGKIDWNVVSEIRSYCRQNRIAIIHTHNYESFLYGVLSKAFTSIFLVHSQHGLVQDLTKFKKAFSKVSLLVKPSLIAVSNSVSEHMASFGWWSTAHATVILNGVNTDEFIPDMRVRKKTRNKLGISESEFVVICVARLAKVKDHQTLLRAFSQFSSNRDDAKLLIVGEGPESHSLLSSANVSNLIDSGKAIFLGERSDIVELLQASDVFMLTSISEGISISLLEGMATGLVPVVTSVGGNVEIINNEQNGLLFEVGNHDAGAAMLEKAYSDKALRKNISGAGRLTVIDNFSFAKMIAGYDKVYQLSIS